jgi:Spy/CpxP family protein refolding chaperone
MIMIMDWIPPLERGPGFKPKLRRIKRLTRAIHDLQTSVETRLLESGYSKEAAKAEMERLKKRDGLNETEMALLIWAMTSVDIYDSLSDVEKSALLPGTYLRLKREHEERVKQLSDLLKSLTPEQRKIVSDMNRKRLLNQERYNKRRNREKKEEEN